MVFDPNDFVWMLSLSQFPWEGHDGFCIDEPLNQARVKTGNAAQQKDGILCPVCGKLSKIYERPMLPAAARFLIELVKLDQRYQGNKWIKYDECGYSARDYSHVEYFQLAQREPSDNRMGFTESNKGASGRWKPTSAGKLFVFGRNKVPRSLILYNSKVLGFSKTTISIQEAIGKGYNYGDLMKGVVVPP